MAIWLRYGIADTVYFPMVARGLVDLATSSAWVPVQSDTRIQIDNASASYATNIVTATGSRWFLSLSASELSGKQIGITIIDAATPSKAVEDQDIEIHTFGSPLAQIPFDFSVSTMTLSQPALDAAATQIVNTVWATASRTLTGFGTLQGDIVNAVWATPSRSLAQAAYDQVVNQMWATPSRTLSSFGTLQTDIVNTVWATASRTLSATGNTDIADALLARNVSGGSSAGRTVKQALHVLRNKVDARAGIVYDTDDTASSWTFSTTTDSDTARITVVDPA